MGSPLALTDHTALLPIQRGWREAVRIHGKRLSRFLLVALLCLAVLLVVGLAAAGKGRGILIGAAGLAAALCLIWLKELGEKYWRDKHGNVNRAYVTGRGFPSRSQSTLAKPEVPEEAQQEAKQDVSS